MNSIDRLRAMVSTTRNSVKVPVMGHLMGSLKSKARNSGVDEIMWIMFFVVAERRGSNHLASDNQGKVPVVEIGSKDFEKSTLPVMGHL